MYPTRLMLQNFVSFENIDYRFESGPTAIVGDNRTQDDQAQNGTGKTSLLNGLFYGIYGINLRQKEDKKLIRYGQNSAKVIVELFCPIRKESCRITREIKMKGSSTLQIEINGEEISIPTINEGNKWIANWIEISAEDAKSYFIVTKNNYKSFFNCSNSDKLSLIGRFINFSNIDKAKDLINKQIEEVQNKKAVLEKQQAVIEGRIEVYQEQIEQILNSNPEEERNEKIKKIRESIDRFELKIKSCQNEIEQYTLQRDEKRKTLEQKCGVVLSVQKELDSKNQINFDDAFNEIDGNIKDINIELKDNRSLYDSQNQTKQLYEKRLMKIETILSGIIECPNCHHRFLLDEKESIDDLDKQSKILRSKIDTVSKEIKEVNQVIEELNTLMKECRSMRNQTEEEEKKNEEQKRQIQSKLKILKNDIYTYTNQIDELNNKITSLQNTIQNNKETVKQYLSDITEINKIDIPITMDISVQQKEIDKLQKEISKLQEEIEIKDCEISKISNWIQRFKDFKMYLAMEQIKNIQNSANEILEKMGSDLRLMIEGFKKNASGKVVEEITPYIFRDEMELYSYYSGGERVRLEIALIIALQQAINSTKKYGGLQFLFVDEILESADSLGIENIISSIQFLNQPILMITHVPRLNEEIRQLKIVKENGISRFE